MFGPKIVGLGEQGGCSTSMFKNLSAERYRSEFLLCSCIERPKSRQILHVDRSHCTVILAQSRVCAALGTHIVGAPLSDDKIGRSCGV